LAREDDKVVSPTYRPPLPPGDSPGSHFCYRLSRHQRHSGGVVSVGCDVEHLHWDGVTIHTISTPNSAETVLSIIFNVGFKPLFEP
jgi:hypothetical protein